MELQLKQNAEMMKQFEEDFQERLLAAKTKVPDKKVIHVNI